MKKFIKCFAFLVCVSCTNDRNPEERAERVQVKDASDKIIKKVQHVDLSVPCDTVVNYNIEDISSEGAEAEACFIKNKLVKCKAIIFGAAGRIEIQYLVRDSVVEVAEYMYKYKKSLTEINAESDIVLSDSARYSIDKNNGQVISGKKSSDAARSYQEIFKKIPRFL